MPSLNIMGWPKFRSGSNATLWDFPRGHHRLGTRSPSNSTFFKKGRMILSKTLCTSRISQSITSWFFSRSSMKMVWPSVANLFVQKGCEWPTHFLASSWTWRRVFQLIPALMNPSMARISKRSRKPSANARSMGSSWLFQTAGDRWRPCFTLNS